MKHHTILIPSREDVLGILRTRAHALDEATLFAALHINEEQIDGMTRRLTAMERDGQIKIDRRGAYQLAHQTNLIAGTVSAHRDGFGFLIRDDGQADAFINQREMKHALHGDHVLARIIATDRKGRSEVALSEINTRTTQRVVGRLIEQPAQSGHWFVIPEDKRFGHEILIQPGGLVLPNALGHQTSAQENQIVTVELSRDASAGLLYVQASGHVVEVLGESDDAGLEIEIAVRKFEVPHIFSEAALAQSQQLPDTVKATELAQRVDLRDVPLVTIDGEDARDFDDAVYCEPCALADHQSGYRLLVAIADVSHYVSEGSALDVEAQLRSTSVYFPRKVIPMLPEKISNGLCSLNPHVDRLCMVCDMVISETGIVQAYQFYPAVMHSAARLTYNQVWSALSNVKGGEAKQLAPVLPQLQSLYELFRVLLVARKQRGAVEFETTETQIVCNASGKIEKIIARTRNDAHRMIEECMLAANVCAAQFLQLHHKPALYRIHEPPTVEKLLALRTFLQQFGLRLNGGDTPAPADYAKLSEQVSLRPDAKLLSPMILRSMQQAVYSPEELGHFGLAYAAYTHFTSPIRRYPDLLVHRAIKAALQNKTYVPVLLVDEVMPKTRARAGFGSGGKNNTVKTNKKPSLLEKQKANRQQQHDCLSRTRLMTRQVAVYGTNWECFVPAMNDELMKPRVM